MSRNIKSMNLPVDQLSKILNSAKNILVIGPENPNVDIVSSAAAWSLFLLKRKKKVDVVLTGRLPKLKFLPKEVNFSSTIEPNGKFKILVDVSKIKIKQLSYDVKDKQLEIDLIPEDGSFKAADVQTTNDGYRYDLIITLGVASFEMLGKSFLDHRHFFDNTPIINIDRSIGNDNFGQLDIVESTVTSMAEISHAALHKYLDKDIATALLAGMISATNSFQSPQVTPQTLELASQLIVKGADRQAVIEALYQTKDIGTLKNWGKVLSRLVKSSSILHAFLEHEEQDNLPEDFQELVHDLILTTPETKAAVIFYQLDFNTTEIWLYTVNNVNALEISRECSGRGSKQFVKFTIAKNLLDSQDFVLDKIQKQLALLNH
jgi:phosphoesterase RecJ-like protein